MPVHTRRAIDPTADGLAALFADVYRRAARDALADGFDPRDGPPTYDGGVPPWTDLLALATELPMSVYARRHRIDWRASPVHFGACWWTDVLGRRHWLAQADRGDDRRSLGALVDDFGLGHGPIDGHHPLEWLAPDLSAGWRSRGPAREFVVACRCGYAGTPESLAWTGALCGPCFDREQEGLPPAGVPPLRPDVGLLSSFHLTAGGRLVGALTQAGAGMHLRVWDAPWAGKPRWGRRWSEYQVHAVSPAGLIAVESSPGRVTLVGLDDGKTRDSRDLAVGGEVQHLAFAGKDGELLVGNFRSRMHAGRSYLRAWAVTPEGTFGGPLYLREHDDITAFTVSPRGQRLIVPRGRAFELRDAESGEVAERLKVAEGGRTGVALSLPDGSVVGSTRMDDRRPPALHRWRPRETPAARGLFDWAIAPSGRLPDATVPLDGACEAMAASPDGRLIASVEDGLVLRDAATLEPRGRFRPSRCAVYPSVAFAAGGQLLALTDRGLAVWPWKELFG